MKLSFTGVIITGSFCAPMLYRLGAKLPDIKKGRNSMRFAPFTIYFNTTILLLQNGKLCSLFRCLHGVHKYLQQFLSRGLPDD